MNRTLTPRRFRRTALLVSQALLPVLTAATPAVLPVRPVQAAPAADVDLKPEAAPTSRMTGIDLPEGAMRLANVGPVAELRTQLQTVAREGGFTLGETETLFWGGAAHTPARGNDARDAVVARLKKAGFNYEVAGEKDVEQGKITLFITARPDGEKKKAVLGMWMANDSFLMLAWGPMTPAGQAADKGAAPTRPDSAAEPVRTPAAPAREGAPSTAVVGKWGFTTISGTTYWDRSTGAYLGSGNGGSQTYTFEPNGRYKMFNYIKTRTYGWQTEALTWEEGTYSVEGDALVIQPTGGKYEVKDNQVAKNNYTRPMREEELRKNAKRMVWTREKDPRTGRPCLMMGKDRSSLVRYTAPE